LTTPAATDYCVGGVAGTTSDPTTYSAIGNYTVTWNYNDGFGNTISQQQIVNIVEALPVELISFSANCLDDKTSFEWTTASERNSSHFELEGSSDGWSWEKIAVESAHVHSDSKSYYQKQVKNSYSLFRLKQVDQDNSYSYSHIVQANCDDSKFEIMAYPNPTNGKFELSFSGIISDETNLTLVNELGQILETKRLQLDPSLNKLLFDLTNYPPGLYFLNVKGNNRSKNIRIIKVKK